MNLGFALKYRYAGAHFGIEEQFAEIQPSRFPMSDSRVTVKYIKLAYHLINGRKT